jgi:hypothetical protein
MRAIVAEARRRGLSMEQLKTAITSFSSTGADKDRGIAAYMKNEFLQAETC